MLAKIKGLTRSDRPICKLDLRSTVRSMIGNIKETFPPKLVCRKNKFCKIQGMLKGSKVHAACNVARLYEISHVKGVERNKNRYNGLDLRHLFLMSKESKVHSIYIVLQLYFSCQRSQKSI